MISDFLIMLAQAPILVLMLSFPGWALLHKFYREHWQEFSFISKLAQAYIASLLILSLLGAGLLAFPKVLIQILTFVILLSSFFALPKSLLLKFTFSRSVQFMFIVLFLGLACWNITVSPLPGSLALAFGDVVAYVRVIDNLVQQSFPLCDFVIGDYISGTYTIPFIHPVPVLSTATLQLLSPFKGELLSMSSLYGGVLALLYAAELIAKYSSCKTSALTYFVITFLPLAFIANAYNFFLSAITLPILIFFLGVVEVSSQREIPKNKKFFVLFICLNLACLYRPEAALLAVLVCLVYLIKLIFVSFEKSYKKKACITVSFCIFLVLGVFILLSIDSLAKNLSVSYLYYQESNQIFNLHPEDSLAQGWKQVNLDNAHEFFANQRQFTQVNSNLIIEIFLNPIEFVYYLCERIQQRIEFGVLLVYVFCVLILLISPSINIFCAGLVGAAFIPILALVNTAFSMRHIYPLFSMVLFLAMLSFLRLKVQKKIVLFYVLGGLILFSSLNAFLITRQVREGQNALIYSEVASIVKRHAKSDSIILSAYPSMLAYLSNIKSVGNINMLETLDLAIAKYQPDFILIDNCRGEQYKSFKRKESKIISSGFPYQVLKESPTRGFVLLQRT